MDGCSSRCVGQGLQVEPGLVEEATRRSGVVWLVAGEREQLVWHVWQDGRAYVVHGGSEQPLSDVSDGGRVLVVVRGKERQADRVVQWWADVHEVVPGSPEWQAVVPALAARRLNAVDAAGQPERWASASTVLALVPDGTGEPVDRG